MALGVVPDVGDDVGCRVQRAAAVQRHIRQAARIRCGQEQVVARLGLGAQVRRADIHVGEHLLMAAIGAGQPVAVQLLLGAVAVEVVVELGEVGLGGNAVIVRVDHHQAHRAIAAAAAERLVAIAGDLARDAVLVVHQALDDRVAVLAVADIGLRAI
ncbi:MAG: hypothetical protein B7Z15_24085, partial [Rhizobiales bacterium 32-66-8]